MFPRALSALALVCAAFAQNPAFEVASVKASEPITPALVQSGRLKMGVTIDALNVRISQFSMYELLTLAFQVKGYQLSGPEWMVTQRYDIQAKLPEGGKRAQVPAMLQSLLAERFGLRFHRDNRELPVYGLVVVKGGPRLTPSTAEETDPAPPGQIRGGISVGPGGVAQSSGPGGDSKVTPRPGGNLHVENRRMSLGGFVNFINRYTDRPVIDMTGLTGTYEMEFDISGEDVGAAAASHGIAVPAPTVPEGSATDPAGVSLADSLRKLGLKLESRKAPFEVIVIDKVEKTPTEN